MHERTEQVAANVTPNEKQAIREGAARAGKSVAAFIRDASLDDLPSDIDDGREPSDGSYPPLKDFIEARLVVDESADPIPKREVYERYVDFCEATYPEHDIENQHKVSREVAKLEGIETGRVYLDTGGTNPTRTRCFLNLNYTNKIVSPMDNFEAP